MVSKVMAIWAMLWLYFALLWFAMVWCMEWHGTAATSIERISCKHINPTAGLLLMSVSLKFGVLHTQDYKHTTLCIT